MDVVHLQICWITYVLYPMGRSEAINEQSEFSGGGGDQREKSQSMNAPGVGIENTKSNVCFYL
jgi:hypothetical protein